MMRRNRHTGEVYLPVDGMGEVRLCFDWAAIAELHATFGKEWEGEIRRIVAELETRGMARILAIASEHSEDWWMEKSPPFMPAANAVQDALHSAFFGAGGLDDRPPLARRLTTLFSRLSRSGSNSAGGPASSGA